jgi:CRISPR-associated protein (TIGR03986 family)
VFWIESSTSTAAAPRLDAFGFSQLFCVPYKRKIEALAGVRGQEEPLSLAEQIFGYAGVQVAGRELHRRGRVAFGPARCTTAFRQLPSQRVIPGNPSATCLGLYLEQSAPRQIQRSKTDHGLKTYDNPNATLRGRKFYWHRRGAWGVLPPNPVAARGDDNVSVEYAPLDKGVKFITTVVVDRLSKFELGGLVASIELPKGHAHKLGLGKAFGLGSARMTIKSFDISSDRSRYRSLREHAARSVASAPTPRDCAALFEREIGSICDEDFERIPEIRELRAITNYEGAPAASVTAYMGLERAHNEDRDSAVYANKPVLPKASQIAHP